MRPIIQKIIVAESLPWRDKPGLARAEAVRHTAARLARLLKAKIELCYAENMDPSYFRDQQIFPLLEAQEKRLSQMAAKLGPSAKAVVKTGDPVTVILERAMSKEPVLVALGTHGRKGIDRMVLGSVAEEIVRHAPCPVMVLGPKAQGKPVKFSARPRLLFATDLEPGSRKAEQLAFGLARSMKARLTLFSFFSEIIPVAFPAEAFGIFGAYPLPIDLKPLRQAKAIRLKHMAELANRDGVACDYKLEEKSRTAAQAILAACKTQDLVIMGTHAHSPLQVALLGGTARQVILSSPVPVITVSGR